MSLMTDTPENIKILNEKLGITERENLFNSEGVKSINEMLESSKRDFEILCNSIASKKADVEEAEKEAKESFDNLSSEGRNKSLQTMESAAAAMDNFNSALESMLSIVDRGNEIISSLYDAIVSTNIIDPDLLNSTAALIHSIRETNENLIQFNLQKMTLEHQYRLAMDSERLKQKNRLELEYFKWELRQRELENKARLKAEENSSKPDTTITDNTNARIWSQSEMAEILRSRKTDDGDAE